MDAYRIKPEVRRHWLVYLSLLFGFVVWCMVDVQKRSIVDPARPDLHMTDFTVYTEAGAAFFDGREPYQVANIRGWTYLYPPLFALLVAPLHAASPMWQVIAWFALSVAMCFGCYFEGRRLIQAMLATHDPSLNAHRWVYWLTWSAVIASLLPALNCLQRGQIGVAKLYLLLVGFRYIVLSRTWPAWIAGGLLFSLSIVLKFTPLLPVASALFVLLVGLTRWSPAFRLLRVPGQTPSASPTDLPRFLWSTSAVAAGCVLFFLLVPAALVGWDSNLTHLQTWYRKVVTQAGDGRKEDFGGDVASMRNQSLANAAYRCGNWATYCFAGGPNDLLVDTSDTAVGSMPMDQSSATRAVAAARFAALLALLATAWRLGRRGDLTSQGLSFGLACVATLVASPVARGHYFVLLFPAVLFMPLWLAERNRIRTAVTMAIVPVALSLAHYCALDLAGRLGVLGLGTTLWYLLACALIGRYDRSASAAVNGSDENRASQPESQRRLAA